MLSLYWHSLFCFFFGILASMHKANFSVCQMTWMAQVCGCGVNSIGNILQCERFMIKTAAFKPAFALMALHLLMGCTELKTAGKEVGHATRDATKAVGHAVKNATQVKLQSF